ncbi:MAG TPA: TonB family protein [Mizugakiibacter sp.]
MQSATVHVHPQPEAVRIAATVAALVLNLAVLMLAMRPLHDALRLLPRPQTDPVIDLREPPAVLPVPPMPALPTAPRTSQPRVQPRRERTPVVAPQPQVETAMSTAVDSQTSLSTAPGAADAAPVEASLSYDRAPLVYPAFALHQRLQGTVTLHVLVDVDGRPLQAEVARSSGSRDLDRSAREQVLAGWHFHPAMQHGTAVRAWALVPVAFRLDNL